MDERPAPPVDEPTPLFKPVGTPRTKEVARTVIDEHVKVDRSGQAWKYGKKYDPEVKAAALAVLRMNDGALKQTERDTGIDDQTIRKWAEADDATMRALERQAALKVASVLEQIAMKCASLLHDDEILAAIAAGPNPEKLATVLGISVEKMQLLRGDPTENNNVGTLAGYVQRAVWKDPDEVVDTTARAPE